MEDKDFHRIRRTGNYCVKIGESVARYGRSFDVFSSDWDYYHSVSMCIQQIGELSVGLTAEFKDATRLSIGHATLSSAGDRGRSPLRTEYACVDMYYNHNWGRSETTEKLFGFMKPCLHIVV
jgi:hypothetical protein